MKGTPVGPDLQSRLSRYPDVAAVGRLPSGSEQAGCRQRLPDGKRPTLATSGYRPVGSVVQADGTLPHGVYGLPQLRADRVADHSLVGGRTP